MALCGKVGDERSRGSFAGLVALFRNDHVLRYRIGSADHAVAQNPPLSTEALRKLIDMARYVEQYDRMKRWHAKFAALKHGRQHDTPSENYVDDVYAFFQNAYHLKDWIKNDPAVSSAVAQDVETYINSDRSLRLCADICNALKHLVLKSSRSNENPQFGKKQYGVTVGGGPTTIRLDYEIDTANGPVDAFQLATDCLGAWDKFRAKHGI